MLPIDKYRYTLYLSDQNGKVVKFIGIINKKKTKNLYFKRRLANYLCGIHQSSH